MEQTGLAPENVWMMVAAALVLLMTPGLAFFYGGMTRAKSALNMMMMSVISMGIIAVTWALWGFSMAAGGTSVFGLFGNPFEKFLMAGVDNGDLISAGYGATFAIITVALISGAVADRTRFGAWVVFVPIWATVVYFPLAFAIWGLGSDAEGDGGIFADGLFTRLLGGTAIDFAGGTVVHINAGAAALVLAMIIGKRSDFAPTNNRPHNIPFTILGAALLWFGWFGFNGGLAADASQGGLIWFNTLIAPAAAMLAWLVVERIRDGHATSIGAASGVVAGLVAITPSCANVSPLGALVIGVLAGVGSAIAIHLKWALKYDDSLDVVGVHLVSGIIGTVAVGFLAWPGASEGAVAGLFYGGGGQQLLIQVIAALASTVYTIVATLVIGLIINATIGFRVSADEEDRGVDMTQHNELAYEHLIEEKIEEALDEREREADAHGQRVL